MRDLGIAVGAVLVLVLALICAYALFAQAV